MGKWAIILLAGIAAVSIGAAPTGDATAAPVGEKMIVLFGVLAAGLLLGRARVFGVSLGPGGVVFAGLAAGYFGFALPAGTGHLGLVLFCYCIGITAGPTFFHAFATHGKQLALLVLITILTGAVTAWVLAKLIGMPTDLAVGGFSGAMSNTPSLAADNEALSEAGSHASIAFGATYLFGVVAVVLFMQIVPRLMKQDLDKASREIEAERGNKHAIANAIVEVSNPQVIGKRLEELTHISEQDCAVTHVLRDDRLAPVAAGHVLEQGQLLRMVGRIDHLDAMVHVLGQRCDRHAYVDLEHERRTVVVTAKAMLNKPLKDLRLLGNYGVTIPSVERHDVRFVPHPDTRLQRCDVLEAVGDPLALERFADDAGHSDKAALQTDVLSLAVGITVGVLIGMIPVPVGGGDHVELGLAGGPLVVGLLFAHVGRIGGLVGYLPRASRAVLTQIGLVFFLANSGVSAGDDLVEVLRSDGATLLLYGAATTLAALFTGFAVARWVMKMNLPESLGAMCAGMTSTPGYSSLTEQTDSDVPVIPYAAGYPIGIILTVLSAEAMVMLLGR